MSGPMQWTPNGMVPIGGAAVASPRADDDEDLDGPPVARPPVRKSTKPQNIVGLARARLREVEAELKRLRRLERERDELRRLLEAAKTKPRAIVREIKRSAG